MTKNKKPKQYDLEDRTLAFAKRVREFVKDLPKTIANIEDIKQLVKASGSVAIILFSVQAIVSNLKILLDIPELFKFNLVTKPNTF